MFAASKTNSASVGGYQISRSLRFNKDDGPYLNRTPASAGTRTTWTFSTWLKISSTGNELHIFDAVNDFFCIYGSGQLVLYDGSNAPNAEVLKTTQLFRDFSAWYHIVLVWDTTQATSSNRVKLYVNGSQVTAFAATTYPALNATLAFNNNVQQRIGEYGGGGNFYFNGYMTEINFIDGTALTPSSFGETNAQTGVWQPKAFAGTYGTNGFYLNFSDNSNTTAATLGKDYSGNGNNWTPNNFSVTAGAGNDSLVDSPTSYGGDGGAGGDVRGNYCTLNPLFKAGGGTPAYTNGNLDMTAGGTGDSYFAGTTLLTAGKWYYEATITAVGTGGTTILIGACRASDSTTLGNQGCYRSTSEIYNLDGTAQTSGATYATNDVIGVAIDIDAGTVKFYKNNTGQGATNSYTFTAGTALIVRGRSDSANPAATFNFGQRPFAYTAPSGFKALCTQNLPTPTIGATTATQAGKFFNAVTYTGTGSSLGVTGVGFQPDWVWVKGRSGATDHALYDAVRGVQKQLESNTTTAETTETTGITAFGSDGFTTGALAQLNTSSATYVAWNWKANGAGSSNTAGTITSTVSVNTTAGFSVVTYTGTGVTASVGHGLGALPQMIIVKRRNSTGDWAVYHRTLGANTYLVLNSTAASAAISGYWQYTPSPGNPTVDWFGIIAGYDVNVSSATYVAYCFAEVAGYSKFGSYTGNGSSDGTFVYTGFRPAYVLFKRTTSAYDWWILDSTRGTVNAVRGRLYANDASTESTTYPYVDFLSNGFKLRDADGGNNASGEPYIYMCFAQNPFKYSLAR
jgi:hypothetical protein